ncbi:hypothetical protein ACF052_04830 [Streptomyces pilosus]|uniref:hypothetical protein n=1 Tax=Streptomyces pilosus TaxID=28893 RepID=UPI003701BB10
MAGDDEQATTEMKRWWRRIPWLTIATVLTAIIGIASLAFTGVATYFGALVARDQLNQSKEEADQQDRWQAVRVTYWVDQTSARRSVHVMNRSPDPVSQVQLGITLQLPDDRGIVVPVWVGQLPPCTELVIYQDTLQYRKNTPWNETTWHFLGGDGQPNQPAFEPIPDDAHWLAVSLFMFSDRAGHTWRRSNGLLEPDTFLTVHNFMAEMTSKDLWGRPTAAPSRPVKVCGDEGR